MTEKQPLKTRAELEAFFEAKRLKQEPLRLKQRAAMLQNEERRLKRIRQAQRERTMKRAQVMERRSQKAAV